MPNVPGHKRLSAKSDFDMVAPFSALAGDSSWISQKAVGITDNKTVDR
jgi:hypothetical protein